MNFRKIIFVLLVFLILFVPVSSASEGDFEIPSVVEDISVGNDGSVNVTEEVVFEFEGSVTGVYREIPLADGQKISDISIETPEYYNKYEIVDEDDRVRIKIWLFEDADKTRTTYDADVKIVLHYCLSDGVKVVGDSARLDYMTWGNQWNTKVDHLESRIHVPGRDDDTTFSNDPDDNVTSSGWTDNNTLTTVVDGIGAYTSFEQHVVMPKSFFDEGLTLGRLF